MLKQEFKITNGSFVALSNKCYHLYDEDARVVKTALKGISRDNDISHQDFLQVLYQNRLLRRDQVRFQYSKQRDMMTMVSQKKKALNSVYTKMCVGDDFVSVQPLSLNGSFL